MNERNSKYHAEPLTLIEVQDFCKKHNLYAIINSNEDKISFYANHDEKLVCAVSIGLMTDLIKGV